VLSATPRCLFELARVAGAKLAVARPVQSVCDCWLRDLPAFVGKNVNSLRRDPRKVLPWEQLTRNACARVWENDAVAALSVRPDHRPRAGLGVPQEVRGAFY